MGSVWLRRRASGHACSWKPDARTLDMGASALDSNLCASCAVDIVEGARLQPGQTGCKPGPTQRGVGDLLFKRQRAIVRVTEQAGHPGGGKRRDRRDRGRSELYFVAFPERCVR